MSKTKKLKEAKALLLRLIDETACRYDHHGYCQNHEHLWDYQNQCVNEQAWEWIRTQDEQKEHCDHVRELGKKPIEYDGGEE